MRPLDSGVAQPGHRIPQVRPYGAVGLLVFSSSLRERREQGFLPSFMLRDGRCDRIRTLPRLLQAFLADGDLLLGAVAPS